MNYKVEHVEVSSLSIHPVIEKQGIINENAFKKYIPIIKEFGFIEPVRVTKESDKLCLINGIARFRAACELGIKTIPVIETSPIESDVFLDHIIRNTTVKRSFKEVAVAASYILNRIGTSQGKKRSESPLNYPINDLNEVAKDRYEIARSVLHFDLSVSSLKRLIKIHEVDQTLEGSKLKLFEMLESGIGIAPVYQIAIETPESRIQKSNRSHELKAKKTEKIEKEELKKRFELMKSIRAELHEKLEKEYEQRYEKVFGSKPQPKSLVDMEWEDRINKLQDIRYRITMDDEELLVSILKKY